MTTKHKEFELDMLIYSNFLLFWQNKLRDLCELRLQQLPDILTRGNAGLVSWRFFRRTTKCQKCQKCQLSWNVMNFKCQMSNVSVKCVTNFSLGTTWAPHHHMFPCSILPMFPCSSLSDSSRSISFMSCRKSRWRKFESFCKRKSQESFLFIENHCENHFIHFIHLTIIVQLSRGWNRRVETSNLEPALWQRPSQRLSTDRS